MESTTIEEEKKKCNDTREVRFCIGKSNLWDTPIHAIIKELRNKHGLTWLRHSMSYHKFSNLREIFQGDLTRKLMDGVVSRDFRDLPCNCNKASKVDGKCAYNEECRKMCLVYRATCTICDQPYIGQTQQKLKERMGGHLNDVRKLVLRGETSDTFAAHFARHCKEEGITKPTTGKLRKMMKVKILWQGNPISCMKSFGKLSCSLCMRERIEILRAEKQEEYRIINSRKEIYGACAHKTRFHRFLKEHTDVKNTSTDDGDKPEKVYKYKDRATAVGDSADPTGSSPRPARVHDVIPPPGDPGVCSPVLVCV
jgi:hypothetical protein